MARDWRCRLFIHRYEEKRNDQHEVVHVRPLFMVALLAGSGFTTTLPA
jgi:hypothetical protein